MKLSFFSSLVALLILPAVSSAAFPVKSIECVDATPTQTAEIYLTTSSKAALISSLFDGISIGFDFGNKLADLQPFKAGSFILNNNPNKDSGIISLIENYSSKNPAKLILHPTDLATKYTGYLTGPIHAEYIWAMVYNHEMICEVK